MNLAVVIDFWYRSSVLVMFLFCMRIFDYFLYHLPKISQSHKLCFFFLDWYIQFQRNSFRQRFTSGHLVMILLPCCNFVEFITCTVDRLHWYGSQSLWSVSSSCQQGFLFWLFIGQAMEHKLTCAHMLNPRLYSNNWYF